MLSLNSFWVLVMLPDLFETLGACYVLWLINLCKIGPAGKAINWSSAKNSSKQFSGPSSFSKIFGS